MIVREEDVDRFVVKALKLKLHAKCGLQRGGLGFTCLCSGCIVCFCSNIVLICKQSEGPFFFFSLTLKREKEREGQ